ncbi:MAG TPA: polyamine ABC transporter substrate-binding protein [Alphaproteobacteria bacterium]|nr:polyamine ABC transporter substrate-binding protein [Alphaproteobacteria bacterium]
MLRCLSVRVLALAAMTAVAALPALAQEKILNVFNWNDYIAKDTLEKFTAETGIKVNYDVYDGNEILEAKLLAGKSGYDVVFPSTSPFFAKQVKAGIYLALDKSKIPNASALDPAVLAEIAKYDPGNAHGLPYLMAGTGVGYNIKKVKELMPDAPIGSLSMVFDPKVLAKVKGCGVTVLDSPEEVFGAALAWLGKDPTSQSDADLKAATDVVLKARPSYKYVHSSAYINDLANANTCVVLGYAGDLVQSRARAKEAGRGVDISIFLPKEGAAFNIDVAAIPKDAPNPDAAHAFINFLYKPEIMAAITDETGYANAVKPANQLVRADLRSDPVVYPPADVRAKLYTIPPAEQAFERARTRAWTRVKTRY